MNDKLYTVSYRYDSPSPAGPFKGKFNTAQKMRKGDSIMAPFGAATVTSCREINTRLLRAAPKMLMALEDLLYAMRQHERVSRVLCIYSDAAEAAIRLARGGQR